MNRDLAITELGEPLSIREVAKLIGVSPWSVRNRLLPSGIPCFRCGPNGKLIFYRTAVIAWLVSRQQTKGGLNR